MSEHPDRGIVDVDNTYHRNETCHNLSVGAREISITRALKRGIPLCEHCFETTFTHDKRSTADE